MTQPTQSVTIDYTNWKGERDVRHILPLRVFFGHNEWHTEPQWLIEAHDLDKSALRTFAMKDIHSWNPTTEYYDSASCYLD